MPQSVSLSVYDETTLSSSVERSSSTHLSIHSQLRNKWVRNNKEWKMNGPPTSLSSLTSRKMRKNFAGVVLLIMAGILICLALSNMVLMAEEEDQKSEKSDSDRITFRSLKGNRKIMNPQSSDAYSVDAN